VDSVENLVGKRSLIVVTGTPSVGKTVFSKLLAKRLKALHVDIGKIAREENLTSTYNRRMGTYVVDMPRLRGMLSLLVKNFKGSIILDGHYAVDAVPSRSIDYIFVLRCHPRVLRKRLLRRGFSLAKVAENVAAEVLDVCLMDALNACAAGKVCEIDTTDKKVDEAVDQALKVFRGSVKAKVGVFDWLTKLEEEGKLEEFMAY